MHVSPHHLLRSVQALETACGILEQQFEACEAVKIAASDLQRKGLESSNETKLLSEMKQHSIFVATDPLS